MKGLKISLVLLCIGILGWVSYSFLAKAPEPPIIPPAPNTFIMEIKSKIESLGKSPNTRLSNKDYATLKNDIYGYANANKFDKNWQENLLKDLDYAYAPVFEKQANYVFDGREWELNKLVVIRSEVNMLYKSQYITQKTKLDSIKSVLTQYDKIVSFLLEANSYANTNNVVTSFAQGFDINTSTNYIDSATKYLNLNVIINNCDRLQLQLNSIPNKMYHKHLDYLSKKVAFSIGKYKSMSSYTDYYNNIYKNVFAEFQVFEDYYLNIYDLNLKLEKDLSSLKEKMKRDNKEAGLFKF